MSNILITGAGGFLGSHLAEHLSSEFSITAVTRQPIPFSEGIDQIRADLTMPDWTHDLDDGVDTVIHLAQSREYRNFPDGADGMFQVNVQSTARLLEWTRQNGAKRFILASTGNVYAPQNRPMLESDPCAPANYYAATKYSAELLCHQYAGIMDIVIVRFFGIYGPGQSRNLVAQIVERVQNGVPVTLSGEHGLCISLLYLDDASEIIRRIVCSPTLDSPLVVNAGYSEPASIRSIAETAGSLLDRDPLFEQTEGAAPVLTCDTTLLHSLYTPATDLQTGLRETLRRTPVPAVQ